MLNIEQTRKILNEPTLSDNEATKIRDSFYALADIIFERWQKERQPVRIQLHDRRLKICTDGVIIEALTRQHY